MISAHLSSPAHPAAAFPRSFPHIRSPIICQQAELTSFLRKANRLLRQASLAALEALVAKYGPSLDPASTSALLAESSSLISDTDLSIAALSLKLAVTLLKQQPSVAQQVVERVLPAGLVLVRSPLLQVSTFVVNMPEWTVLQFGGCLVLDGVRLLFWGVVLAAVGV
jgi:hypothetical protein